MEIENTVEQSILMAAEELFLERGYVRASTTAIAQKAGCNQAMVHYYFRSKENLFGKVFRSKMSTFLSQLWEVGKQEDDFEQRMADRVAAHFEFLRTNERMPVVFFNEIATNSELIQKVLPNFKDLPIPTFLAFQKELDEACAAGLIRKTLATDLLYQIFALNVVAFLTKPVFQLFNNFSEEEVNRMLEERKASNIRTVLLSLKPDGNKP
jgi:AcrR family transcriptional regulator